ncbi:MULTISPECIES: dihydroxyacetone kinase operon transcriptional regulator DhaR [Enterobacteriaceae]|uniref:DNA-binding transcriptional regulator DhaR n=2 Tax=Enterobacteriaceae TaxID=543 RepID=A0A144UZW2_ENTCL|nr:MULTISPECIES: dihydroxyacetone kinase operon transcriptional regulator DhaR [Enterobacteriaceae]MDC0728681.1 dihydroxyacetone kinase operon transcriptional regulator DhaR [Phytobacter diazotrophicus]MDC0735915.1 dihydroxyacetone kinase operon transcriptional regulator DhaR [Phytobacter diazotrophicus]CZW45301.1 DNA-binding transcriptional regulator DhaR [Enterobacter cloacae]SAH85823.1 DNA-binding transcriptional regulator DhaR [Enterobacter cloacae]BDD53486.1 sigma-54-dependent Fis family 
MTAQTQSFSSVITQSWHRCSRFMQREIWQVPHQAQGLTFESICRRKTALLTIGQAALEDAWEFMDTRPCALFILDESACILSRCGDPQTLIQLETLGFHDGSYCAESIIGSCALSLASMLGQPIKTSGKEHFKQALHPWSFCSTPVFDNHGRLFGSISLCCLDGQQAGSDLSLTLSTAREVGNSLLTDSLLAESNRHLNQMYGLLESMDDGVMAWNEQGVLQFLNMQAATLLHLDAQVSQGKNINELVTLPALLRRAIKQARGLNHVEVIFESQHQFVDAVITLKPIVEEQGNSFILLLHPVEQMRQLMTSQLGKVSHTFEQMSADDPETRRLIHFGRQAARGIFPVLLCGEEGVGKELLAQAIHNESERAEGPFIAVNCQLYADNTPGQDFMGNAPTDDEHGRLSRLELANGGTLFLEKIEYLAPELQSALLQVIKQGVLTRLDARRLIPVDVKVIATTTAGLANLVEQNRFSRQLYYALHSFEIVIPPLRARLNSIPSLVHNRLRSLEKRFSLRLKVDDDVLSQLAGYSWPGNDFELNSIIENIAISSDNGHIRLSSLPEYLFSERFGTDSASSLLPASLTFTAIEKEAIIHAARVTSGRVQEMSRLLNIGRTTLWRKMKLYNIDASQFRHRRQG